MFRVIASVLGGVGALFGLVVSAAERGARFGAYFYFPQIKTTIWMDNWTILMSMCALFAALFAWKWKRAAIILWTVALVGGAVGALTVWEFPGMFIFVALAVMAISASGLGETELLAGAESAAADRHLR
ncbi:MAG: hypothetical protein ACYCVB_02245 [Bacilli bacterium]